MVMSGRWNKKLPLPTTPAKKKGIRKKEGKNYSYAFFT